MAFFKKNQNTEKTEGTGSILEYLHDVVYILALILVLFTFCMRVVIVSGSGNQGITASVPVVVFAQEMGIDEEKMLRGLFDNLQKCILCLRCKNIAVINYKYLVLI